MLADLVTVFGFTSILLFFPRPVYYFPIWGGLLGSLLGAQGLVDGAFIGMVCGLFFGVPYMLINIMATAIDRR